MENLNVPSDEYLRLRYEALLRHEAISHENEDTMIDTNYLRWMELKRMVIVYGLPNENTQDNANQMENEYEENMGKHINESWKNSLRGQIWCALLGVSSSISKEEYDELVKQGVSNADSAISDDTFRTFRGDAEFARRVPEEKLLHLLNAFLYELSLSKYQQDVKYDQTDQAQTREHSGYFQGMNVLCAPFLFIMDEKDAFQAFSQLMHRHCPFYMAPGLKGVEIGWQLVDECLLTLDPTLYNHLRKHGINAQIYAYPLILTLFACVPPLEELLKLWDALFALGVHFIVLFVVAHTVLLREELLEKNRDLMSVLSPRVVQHLEANKLVSLAVQLIHRLPDEILFKIARHPYEDPNKMTSLPFSTEIIEALRSSAQKKLLSTTKSSMVDSKQSKLKNKSDNTTQMNPCGDNDKSIKKRKQKDTRNKTLSSSQKPHRNISSRKDGRPAWK